MNCITKQIGWLTACLCLGAATLTAQENKGVSVEHLGTNNTLVRVTEQGKYLLLPVQDAGEEATIHVLANGKEERSIVVRLAT